MNDVPSPQHDPTRAPEVPAGFATAIAQLDLPANVADALLRWRGAARAVATHGGLDEQVAAAAAGDRGALDELLDAFACALPIGTGGRRGRVGVGPNRINEVVLRETAIGVARTLAPGDSVTIAYDTRRDSRRFARVVAEQLAALGHPVFVLDEPRPTPQLSFEQRRRGSRAGIVLSASHNPPEDNGIKVYGPDGAQVLGAVADALQAAIEGASADPAPPSAAAPAPVHALVGAELADVDALYHAHVLAQGVTARDLGASGLRVVYTPLHGVGGSAVPAVLAQRGLAVIVVPEQMDPDEGRFSTVASANPEDPRAMDRARALADAQGAQLVLANDPDADRLGALARDRDGVWHALDGNQLGALLLDHVLRHDVRRAAPDQLDGPAAPWVLTTFVTTPLIAAIARAHGVAVVDDLLVGFKHHAGMVREQPARPLLFGCEESHGYVRGNEVRDKDGAMAALLLCELAAELAVAGETLLDALDRLHAQHGAHVERSASLMAPGVAGREAIAAAMEALRRTPPAAIAGLAVRAQTDRRSPRHTGSPTRDLPGDVLVLELAGDDGVACRLVLRPSGTEPKLKLYALAHGRPPAPSSAGAGRAPAAAAAVSAPAPHGGAPSRAEVDARALAVLEDARRLVKAELERAGL